MIKTISIIGTVGLPANYGAFETLTEYLAKIALSITNIKWNENDATIRGKAICRISLILPPGYLDNLLLIMAYT